MKSKRLETLLLLVLAVYNNTTNLRECVALESVIIKMVQAFIEHDLSPQKEYTKTLMNAIANPDKLWTASIYMAAKSIKSKDLSVVEIKRT